MDFYIYCQRGVADHCGTSIRTKENAKMFFVTIPGIVAVVIIMVLAKVLRMEKIVSKEGKFREIKSCKNKKDSLYYIHRKDAARFEEKSKKEGKCTIPIMAIYKSILG